MATLLSELKSFVSTRKENITPRIKKKPLIAPKKFSMKLDEFMTKHNRSFLYNIHDIYIIGDEKYVILSKKFEVNSFIYFRNLPYIERHYFFDRENNSCTCKEYRIRKTCEHKKNFIVKIEEIKYFLILIMKNKFDNFELSKFLFYETKDNIRRKFIF